MIQTATFGGGCFCCLDAQYRKVRGVKSVTSGYAGGDVENPSYEHVSTGASGHAEVVQIEFDDEIINYETLLEMFWYMHDPTTPNRQGNDFGTQYRSIILYHNDEQKKAAEQTLESVAEQLWDKPIVTQIEKLKSFYPAEEYHQDYFNKNPNAGYCQVVINPKLAKFRKRFSDYLTE